MHNIQDIFAVIWINIIDFQQQQQQDLWTYVYESDDDGEGLPKMIHTHYTQSTQRIRANM